jgi:hypothetical protein
LPTPSPSSFPRKRESGAYIPARRAASFEFTHLRFGDKKPDSRPRGNGGNSRAPDSGTL